MTSGLVTVHVLIEGRVQGVGYRAWCADTAIARGLSGWVRNRTSGAVEAVFSGQPAGVADMLDAVWRGPRLAKVTGVKELDPVELQEGPFKVRETA
nr:acylphosphatase [Roseibium sp. MMSF_3544]